MSKTYRAYDPDLSDITARYEQARRGGPPYHPQLMVKVLLYGYCVGVASSRRIAQRLHEDIAFRVLAANNTPDFRTISDFRKDNLAELSDLFLSASGQTGIVPVDWAGEAGACGVGRDQGQGQRIEAPGDELRADEGEVGAVGGGVAAASAGSG